MTQYSSSLLTVDVHYELLGGIVWHTVEGLADVGAHVDPGDGLVEAGGVCVLAQSIDGIIPSTPNDVSDIVPPIYVDTILLCH